MFSGAPWKLYPRVAFCGCCEVGAGGGAVMSTWFSRCKVMTFRFLVCVGAGPVLRYKDLILSASYVWWNEETTGWKSRSVSTPRDGTRGLIQAVCHSSVLVSYFFLGNASNGGMKCPVGLIQVTTVARDPRSADWTEDISRLHFNPNIFVCLCCTIVMPVSSQL